jgi:hypothetical protein
MTIAEFIIKRQWESQQRGVLSMWTIYDHPRDFPDSYVARRFEVTEEGSFPTTDTIVGHELESLRLTMIEAGLVTIGRDESDESQIIETWL